MFGYFENYRICHEQLSIWLHLNDDTIKTTTILLSDVDSNGLLPELTKQLSAIGVHLLYDKQINGYQGFALSFRDYATISRIELNYYFARLMSIVFKYDLGKGLSDKKVIFDSGVLPNVDLIGLLGGGGSRNRICTKTIYPLFNGRINRITVSSNLLATSQYINGHETATIAELQIGPSTNAQINPMEFKIPSTGSMSTFSLPWVDTNSTPIMTSLVKSSRL